MVAAHLSVGKVVCVMRNNRVRKDDSSLDVDAALFIGWICQRSFGRMKLMLLFRMSTLVPKKWVSGTVSSWMGFL